MVFPTLGLMPPQRGENCPLGLEKPLLALEALHFPSGLVQWRQKGGMP